MEFERIGKNTVQCRMTIEEMNEYGLGIEDFFTNQDKSRDFLEHLVERAEEEIGYEVESGMISMQLMRMPDDSLVITFSDRGEESIQNMLNHIQNLAGMTLESLAEKTDSHQTENEETAASEETEVNVSDFIKGIEKEISSEQYEKQQKELKKKRKEEMKKQQIASKVFCFDSLSAVEDFVSTLHISKNIPSRLYKDVRTEKWYLYIKKGKLRLEEYQELCQHLSEYALNCSGQPYKEIYCKEHFQCMIGKQAIKTIKQYIG